MLSRSLEADPASETLWMVYLLICYSRRLFVGKDDMFSFAVCKFMCMVMIIIWTLHVGNI